MKKILLLSAFFLFFTTANSQSLHPSFTGKGYTAVNFPSGNFYYKSPGQVLRKNDGSYYILFEVNDFPVLSHYFANANRDPNFVTGGDSQTIKVTEAKAALQPMAKSSSLPKPLIPQAARPILA